MREKDGKGSEVGGEKTACESCVCLDILVSTSIFLGPYLLGLKAGMRVNITA